MKDPGSANISSDSVEVNQLILIGEGKSFVLDWMTATRGNPAADVARTSMLLKWADPGLGIPAFVRVFVGGIRRKFFRHYLEAYCELTGIRRDEIERWELPVLAARLMEWLPIAEKRRLLSIIEQRLKMIQQGAEKGTRQAKLVRVSACPPAIAFNGRRGVEPCYLHQLRRFVPRLRSGSLNVTKFCFSAPS